MKKHSLPRDERITGKKSFSFVFDNGIPVSLPNGFLKLLFIFRGANDSLSPVRVGIAVSKRAGNAVWRNRVRRVVRESYRTNKPELLDHCNSKCVGINVVFIPYGFQKKFHPDVCLKDIEPLMRILLQKLIEKI